MKVTKQALFDLIQDKLMKAGLPEEAAYDVADV